MNSLDEAKRLNSYFGWNIIPMYYFSRDEAGNKQHKLIDWQQYKSQPYDLNDWDDKYKNLAVITGKISNLTIVDIDSEEALKSITDQLGMSLYELAEYIVKTTKGYQLFYTYEANTTTRISIKDKIDFLNGGISFALDINDGYETIKDNIPQAIPEALKALIIKDEFGNSDTESLKAFENALRENSDLPYMNPLAPIIKDFIDSTRLSKKLKQNLENIFCTKEYKNYTLEDFGRSGQKHISMMYVGGIVSGNPTVNKNLFLQFMEHWAIKIAKIDMGDTRERQLLENRIQGCLKYFRYEDNWKTKSEELKNPTKIAEKEGFDTWYNPETNKYVIYSPEHNIKEAYPKDAFKDAFIRELKIVKPEIDLQPHEVDVTVVKKVYETFDPTVDDTLFTDERGVHYFNNFKRTELLSHFQTCEPRYTLPSFINSIIYHLYPNKEEREMFLHTLAYHMTYLQVSPTCYILTGRSGTGKNTLFQTILQEIYGDMHTMISADTLTGRFRNALKNKLLVFLDEVSEKNHKTSDRGSIHNVIKQVVANKEISIESKGVDEHTYPNNALYVLASNKETPFKLEEGFDRRINITTTNPENIRNLEWFPKDKSNLEIDKMIRAEVKEFVEYLAGIELDHVKWGKTIENKQRQSLIDSSVPFIDRYVNYIMEQDIESLIELDHDFGTWFEENIIEDGRSYITIRQCKEELGDIANKVIKGLKQAEVPYKNIYLDGRKTRVLVVNPKGSSNPFSKA